MKKIILFVALAVSTMLSASDVIVLKNSTRIDAKILEVSETEIKYKKAGNPDGPVFTQRISGISAILYENGEVVSYANQPTGSGQDVQVQESGSTSSANSEKKASKIQFNPQPSDHYWIGFTAGYVSKQLVNTTGSSTQKGSLLLGVVGKTTPAMRAGLAINPTFKYGLGLRTGLYLEYARESVQEGELEDGYGEIYKMTAHDITLSVPVQLSYRYEVVPKFSLMFYTGPVFDFGAYLMQEGYYYYKGAYDIPEENTEKSDNLYSNGDGYKGFNALWGVGAGIQYSRFRIDVGGEFGMVNKVQSSSVTAHWNKPVYVTLTCFF